MVQYLLLVSWERPSAHTAVNRACDVSALKEALTQFPFSTSGFDMVEEMINAIVVCLPMPHWFFRPFMKRWYCFWDVQVVPVARNLSCR